MALVVKDRVKETTTTTGTGTVTLAGAATGFQSFSVIGNANTTYYAIVDNITGAWEVGIGTYTSVGTTLSRDTVLESSNAGSLVNFGAGSKDVFCTYPAEKAVLLDANNALFPANDLPAVISTNTTTPALRITQTGSGNALLVEDSTNPDSTPFVIDSEGRLIQGNTAVLPISGNTAAIQQHGLTSQTSAIASVRWQTANAGGPQYIFAKSRSGAVGSYSIISNGDVLGTNLFAGDDGTSFVAAASILAAVDGTPGTNDMPGRLVFSTTADGASSPTERMRINSAGNIAFGYTGANQPYHFLDAKTITGGTTSGGFNLSSTIQSDVTATAIAYGSGISTAAAAFTLTNLQHYRASQGTIGAGSAITNQYGFVAESNFTGATNNYGFYSNIASGTGRWNFYANGTAANVFAGTTHIGGTVGAESLRVTPVASAVNYLQTQGSITGSAVVLSTQGSDTNISIALTPKGTGNVGVGTTTPGEKLDVSGSVRGTQLIASNGLIVNNMTVSDNYTIPTGYSASSVGPITVNSGVSVTVPSGSKWVVL